ncbi:hypothetical protein ALP39_200321 [Pseudomonas marginalis pv. marginalis]|nr:hypothetical protein ALP39_200321 [Pseudomonas marginalis pv. marginalis]
MLCSTQPRLPLVILPRNDLRVALEEPTEVSRILEPKLIADFIDGTACEQQQTFSFLHQTFHHRPFGRQVGDTPTHVIEPCFRHPDTVSVTRKGSMLQGMSFNRLIEPVEKPALLPTSWKTGTTSSPWSVASNYPAPRYARDDNSPSLRSTPRTDNQGSDTSHGGSQYSFEVFA